MRQPLVHNVHDVENSVGFHCNITYRAYLAALTRELSELNMTPVQFKALARLVNMGAMSQQELDDVLGITPATGAKLFQRMERDGWIGRTTNPEDSRQKVLTPTEKAMGIWDRAEHIGSEFIRGSLTNISDEDFETCKRVLAQVRQNLSEM